MSKKENLVDAIVYTENVSEAKDLFGMVGKNFDDVKDTPLDFNQRWYFLVQNGAMAYGKKSKIEHNNLPTYSLRLYKGLCEYKTNDLKNVLDNVLDEFIDKAKASQETKEEPQTSYKDIYTKLQEVEEKCRVAFSKMKELDIPKVEELEEDDIQGYESTEHGVKVFFHYVGGESILFPWSFLDMPVEEYKQALQDAYGEYEKLRRLYPNLEATFGVV